LEVSVRFDDDCGSLFVADRNALQILEVFDTLFHHFDVAIWRVADGQGLFESFLENVCPGDFKEEGERLLDTDLNLPNEVVTF
jgi:hypothetical protein